MITKTTNVYNSSLVKESVYDFETKQLIVFFPSAEYHYHGVSADDYNEFANADSQGKALLQQSIVFKELKPTSDILMKYGLSDYAYPLIEKIRDDKAIAFLVVLYPETDYFNFWRVLWNSLFIVAAYNVVSLVVNYIPQVTEWFQSF